LKAFQVPREDDQVAELLVFGVKHVPFDIQADSCGQGKFLWFHGRDIEVQRLLALRAAHSTNEEEENGQPGCHSVQRSRKWVYPENAILGNKFTLKCFLLSLSDFWR
jgi:hypothetical protein